MASDGKGWDKDVRVLFASYRRLAVGFGLLGLLATGCGTTSSAPEPLVPDATLHLAQQGDVPTLDPAAWSDPDSYIYMHAIYDTLVQYNPAGTRVLPDLAVRWRVEDGGRRYVFFLRQHVEFSNGDPFDARSVLANFERVTSEAAAAPYAQAYSDIAGFRPWHSGHAPNLAGIRVLGRYEVAFQLERPEAYFLDTLALMSSAIGDPRLEARYGLAGYSDHAVGTGPYRVAVWRHGQVLVLTRNPHYWGPRPRLARIVTAIGPDPERQLLLFEQGRVDVLSLTPDTYLKALGAAALQQDLRRGVAASLYYVGFNTTRPPLDETMVRQALNEAVDKRQLIADVTYGQARLDNDGLFPPTLPGYDPHARLAYPYDPAKARRLLAQAGFTPRHPLRLTDVFYDDPSDSQLGEMLASQLRAVGVEVRLQPLDWQPFVSTISNPRHPFDLYQLGWSQDYPDPQDFFDNLVSRAEFGNTDDTYWNDPAVQALLRRADALPAQDQAERLRLYREINRRVVVAAPYIFLYYGWNDELIQPWLRYPDLGALGLGPVYPLTLQDLSVARHG